MEGNFFLDLSETPIFLFLDLWDFISSFSLELFRKRIFFFDENYRGLSIERWFFSVGFLIVFCWNFDSLEKEILTVWERKFWQFGKENFDSLKSQFFDSLKREILTAWKGKFWQFGKEILTVWKRKFWQFEMGNFDSLKRKFWQFGKGNIDRFLAGNLNFSHGFLNSI